MRQVLCSGIYLRLDTEQLDFIVEKMEEFVCCKALMEGDYNKALKCSLYCDGLLK